MHALIWLVSGFLAGWLVGFLMQGRGYGLIGDLIIGMLGGLCGGWLFHRMGIITTSSSWFSHLLVAVIGGIILVAIYRLIRRLL